MTFDDILKDTNCDCFKETFEDNESLFARKINKPIPLDTLEKFYKIMQVIDIKHNYTILHYDEFPILFIGKNYKSDVIIGSFLFEENDSNTLKYFHSIVNPDLAIQFLNREIPYLDVLKNAVSIYIVSKDFNDNILNKQKKNFNSIDKTILPLPSALCPKTDEQTILTFEDLGRLQIK